jgi:hypothetical protein
MAGRVVWEFTAKPALYPEINGQRPWPDQRHVAFEDVQKLREFVEAERS